MKKLYYCVINLNNDENGTAHTIGIYDTFEKAYAMATIDMITPDTDSIEGKGYIKDSDYLLISESEYKLHTRIDVLELNYGFE